MTTNTGENVYGLLAVSNPNSVAALHFTLFEATLQRYITTLLVANHPDL